MMEYQCSNCQESFQSNEDYIIHRRTHKNTKIIEKKYVCHICGKSYARKTSLMYHLDTFHNVNNKNVFVFECVFCDNKFSNYEDLMEHNDIHKVMNTNQGFF